LFDGLAPSPEFWRTKTAVCHSEIFALRISRDEWFVDLVPSTTLWYVAIQNPRVVKISTTAHVPAVSTADIFISLNENIFHFTMVLCTNG